MKIDNTTRTPALNGELAPATRDAKTAPATGQSGRSPQDSVTLSAASSRMQDLVAQVNADKGFDASRVEALKQAISDGRYAISPETIADKLLASNRALLTRKN